MEPAALLKEWGPFAGAAVVGALPWFKIWRDSRKDRSQERSDLIKIAQDAAKGVIKDLREEVDRLQRQIAELESEMTADRKEHAQTIAAKDAEIALLRGRLRQALATADTYERTLTANNIPHEPPAQPFWLIEAGDYPVELSQP